MKIDLDLTQRLAIGQLSKGNVQKMGHAGEILNLVIATVSGHASRESAQGKRRHELRENKHALVYCGPLRAKAIDHKSWNRSSNRDPPERLENQSKINNLRSPDVKTFGHY